MTNPVRATPCGCPSLRRPAPPDVSLPSGCSVIYRPRGRAREYAALAANLYAGCAHACVYCWGPAAMRRTRAAFTNAAPRGGPDELLARLDLDGERCCRAGVGGQVLLCFSCDPYQPLDDKLQVTRDAIKTLHHWRLAVSILTKGGARALRDLDLLGPGDTFGTTLTLLNPAESAIWEPGAAPPEERIQVLEKFHRYGIPTWVSLEPVIDCAATLQLIRATAPFVDLYRVGKMNYHPSGLAVDWRRFAQDAVALLESLGKPYYLKADLAAHLED